ncbi:hypothetical protein F8M41_005715 [Gigaspora margarita]|uniref:Uncharacterized protein n=1 Tax=Gigaspora margarita TaxID=4874 RepID=A0A8H3XA89_GIGMA|nr:hypothetical protein F8M41_005715 [Gigaspora margarita]
MIFSGPHLLTKNYVISGSPLTEQNKISKTINDDIVDDPEEYWSHIIENWIDILDTENYLVNEEAMNNKIPEFEFGEHIIYSVKDPLTKWNLLELFNDSLKVPISFVF